MRVVIVDDHPLVRKGLASILTMSGTIELLGEATNSKEALKLFKTTNPELALVDLRLGKESGLDLIKEAQNQGVTCKFVVLTSSTDERDFTGAKELGVSGYILKEAFPEELLHALNMIRRGRNYYDQGVLDFAINMRKAPDKERFMDSLTPKETEVLIELGKGLSNKEISQMMYITEYTVKKHVSQVLAKLNLADRTHAALYANAKGLVHYSVN